MFGVQVGSRHVMVYAGLIAIGLAVFGKFGTLLSTIPNLVAYGILMVEFGISGLETLLNSLKQISKILMWIQKELIQ